MNENIKKYVGGLILLCLASTLIISFFDINIIDEAKKALWIFNGVLCAGFFTYYTLTQGAALYVCKRVGEALVVLLVIATLTFALLRFMPGGPFDSEKALPPEVKANIEAKYHLNEPVYVQYYLYLTGLLKGDLGESYKYIGRDVSDIITETFPVSFKLGAFSLIVAFMIGIPLGVFAGANHNTWKDNFSMLLAISGVSLPSFLIAPILIIVFCFWLDWLPTALWRGPEYYILPVFILGIRPAAAIARLTRASVLEVIRSDYIRTAKAKGLAYNIVLYKHVLKNSLIPVLTYSGPLIAGILSGAFIIELIFAVPGMGKHLIQSVTNRDYPLILGVTLLYSAMLVISNLIVDLLYSYFDPRIKLS